MGLDAPPNRLPHIAALGEGASNFRRSTCREGDEKISKFANTLFSRFKFAPPRLHCPDTPRTFGREGFTPRSPCRRRRPRPRQRRPRPSPGHQSAGEVPQPRPPPLPPL